jgi:diacylglycerol kinase (ATP)
VLDAALRPDEEGQLTRVAVVAHREKVLGDGLPALRRMLQEAGVDDLIWHEVPKSRKAPKQARRAVAAGADLLLIWGGDGMMQRCIDAVVGSKVTLGVLPAGTANLLATDLGIPRDLGQALKIALDGSDRVLDVGRLNGEHFAVMAGAGLDAQMIAQADSAAKKRLGRLAYVRTGLRAVGTDAQKVTIRVDGTPWFKGSASCVLVGNVGTASGGLVVFDDASPDDGLLDVGVVTAEGFAAWLRVLARVVRRQAPRSPFVSVTKARKIDVRFAKPVRYEMDGGARTKTRRLEFKIVPKAVTVRVPTENVP